MTRRSTRTIMVLFWASLTTMPWRTRFGISAPCPSGARRRRRRRSGRLTAALGEDRLDTRDVAPRLADARGIFELPARALKAQVEDFLAQGLDLVGEFVGGAAAQIARLGRPHTEPSSPGRTTNLVATGSFAAASSNASRATSRSTPSSSNMMRPGLTRAIQYSGEPLPLPMR